MPSLRQVNRGHIVVYYVAHRYGGKVENIDRAKRITHDLQISDLNNTYICPLIALSELEYGEVPFESEMDLCLDILQMCDKLIVASDISKGVQMEIDFANLIGMEVSYNEDDG